MKNLMQQLNESPVTKMNDIQRLAAQLQLDLNKFHGQLVAVKQSPGVIQVPGELEDALYQLNQQLQQFTDQQ